MLVAASEYERLTLAAARSSPMEGLLGRRLCTPDRSPMPQPLGDEFCALAVVASVQDAHVGRRRAQIDAGGARIDLLSVRTSGPVSRCAVGGLQPNLSGSLQLRRVRLQRSFALPIVEDARSILPLLDRFAPVSRRE